MNPESKRNTFGICAVIAAFLALLTVLVGPAIHDAIVPKPNAEERIAETAVKLRDHIKARLKGAPITSKPSVRRLDSDQLPYTMSLALAGAAIIGGCVSYLRREDHRYAYVACGVGAVSLAWHAVLLALGAIVLCVILYYILPSVFDAF